MHAQVFRIIHLVSSLHQVVTVMTSVMVDAVKADMNVRSIFINTCS